MRATFIGLLLSTTAAAQPDDPSRCEHWFGDGRIWWDVPIADYQRLFGIYPRGEASLKLKGPSILEGGASSRGFQADRFGVTIRCRSSLFLGYSWRADVLRHHPESDVGMQRAVQAVILKRGDVQAQWSARRAFDCPLTTVDADTRACMLLWPMWDAGYLMLGPLSRSLVLPTPEAVDAVAERWSLDRFDPRSVSIVRRMASHPRPVLPTSADSASPFADAYVREFVKSVDEHLWETDDAQADQTLTCAAMIRPYVETVLANWKAEGDADAQLAELDGCLEPWKAPGMGIADIWTSFRVGLLDCDALSMVAAEVLARRGWTATMLEVNCRDDSPAIGTKISHALLCVTPPLESGDESSEPAHRRRLFDATGLPRESMIANCGGSESAIMSSESNVLNDVQSEWVKRYFALTTLGHAPRREKPTLP